MRALLLALALIVAACASTPGPKLEARMACENWLGRHNLMQRPERGSRDWDGLVKLCVAKHMGAAGEIDRALASK